MAEQLQVTSEDPRAESGTTLVELLVVIVLMGIVGTVTTAGIVAGFRAQLDASNVAETLDGMRLATQRVRDFAREADEVCASSTAKSLVLWTDDNDDGLVADTEKDIFELDTTVTPRVFQRRVPGSSEVQIIRDDILDDALFEYDDGTAATDQSADLACKDGKDSEMVAGAVSKIRSVGVTFIVEHPDPDGENLTTSTRVRIRNADLLPEPNNSPVAGFTSECDSLTRTCTFDASSSSDPDGTISTYTWDFGDGTTGPGVAPSHPYTADGEYPVTLVVVDDEGAVDTVRKTVVIGLFADFTYSCDGRTCDFDGSASRSGGSIVSWDWYFDDEDVPSYSQETIDDHPFPSDGTYSVRLVVTDDDGATRDEVKSVVASEYAVRVEALDATITNKTNNYDVTFIIELSRTTSQPVGAGIVVSVELSGGTNKLGSCSTNTLGQCSIELKSIDNQRLESLLIINLTDATGTYTYDPNQNKVDELVVDKNGVIARYKDGEEVTP